MVFSVFPDDSITWRRQVQMFKGYRLGSGLTKDIAIELLQSPMDLPSAGVFKVFFKSLWGFNKIEEERFLLIMTHNYELWIMNYELE